VSLAVDSRFRSEAHVSLAVDFKFRSEAHVNLAVDSRGPYGGLREPSG